MIEPCPLLLSDFKHYKQFYPKAMAMDKALERKAERDRINQELLDMFLASLNHRKAS